jgi:acetamidase/formamidase
VSTHTIQTDVEYRFTFPGLAEGDFEIAYPTLDIEFSFTPGCPATGPSYSSGGEPADPAEVEIISVKLVNADGVTLSDDQLKELADKWLDGAGYQEACDAADAQSGPDPDAAYEAMRDEFYD